jgi:hypothetical protein
MNLQYSLSARLDLALIRGEKFRVKVVGKPILARPTLTSPPASVGLIGHPLQHQKHLRAGETLSCPRREDGIALLAVHCQQLEGVA